MRILILGGSGMLGHRLWIELSKHYEVWGTVRSAVNQAPVISGVDRARIRGDVDANNFDEIVRALAGVEPDVVINCIGVVKQHPLSNDPLTALEINALLPHRLSLIAKAAGIRLIHFSTDCVFSGKKSMPYSEDDQSDAEDLYGRTKFLGEIAYGPHTLSLRTSIIGRELETQHGLVEWFLNQHHPIKGWRNAIFSGFTTNTLAQILLEYVLPNPKLAGVYHLSSEALSKFDLLNLVNKIFKCGIRIDPDNTMNCNRALDSTRFRIETGFHPPSWPEMIREMHDQSLNHDGKY